ncbi:CdaR family transcriptional regulator [Planococcus beigongshangi]|uniref:CdaR family transcriptional regulator n=1 Tax=Planococcus beigongshangi TaxID=2782536 RepID=UPI00193C7897|nr:sugar diacid recognition domain-containing protein [Planococcus beigongshangi]
MFDFESLSSQIVNELTSLIDENVIVTDKNGFIIASTDPQRLETFHEGATLAMEKQQEIRMTKEMCEKLDGVRPGIVMPLIVLGAPIGVIGVTGKPDQVDKYAKLVRKVTELFITDSISRQEKERHIREIEFFFFDLITASPSVEIIENRAKMINIDISLYRRIAVIQTYHQLEITDVESLLRIQKIHPELKIIRWGMKKLILLIPDIKKEKLVDGIGELLVKIQGKKKQELPVGVGNINDIHELKRPYQQAETALAVAERREGIVFEEDLKLELLYYSIPDEIQEEFLNRTLAPLYKKEELLRSLETWIKMKKSLQVVADELHIHKNTLIYRLNNIQSILNMDLHNTDDLMTLYTAIRLYRKK